MLNSTVSVVICTYTEQRWRDLLDAVRSATQQSLPPDEVVVVVDHNDALRERIRTHVRDVVLLDNQEAPGLSGARNCGVGGARGQIIAFLDDDAVAAPDWLAALTRGYHGARVMGVGGAVEPVWPDRPPRWFPAEFNWVVGCSYRGLPETPAPVRNLLGANMSFRREVFAAVGGFRTGIGRVGMRPVGCEETELCVRARQRWPNRYFLYEPDARVFHRLQPERACWRYFRARCYAEGLSKAQVARFVGVRDGLSAERAHALRTLPRAVVRGLADAALGGDASGAGRAAAIVAGLAITAAGYLSGSVADRSSHAGARC